MQIIKLIIERLKMNKKKDKAYCYWITGLPASGKTTMAKMLTDYLKKNNKPTIQLDGDILREILDVKAYSLKERYILALKYSSLCKLIVEHNINVVIGVVGLFHKLHEWNRNTIPNYCEIFLNTPLEELMQRDPKGIYKSALDGKLKNVAGLDLKVEYPLKPNIEIVWNSQKNIQIAFEEIIKNLEKNNWIT
jgi:adenylylsulfate kinase-like enzyme